MRDLVTSAVLLLAVLLCAPASAVAGGAVAAERTWDDVYLGAHVVINQGVTVRRGCVVGANSVVLSDTEEYGFYVGAPASVGRPTESTLTAEPATARRNNDHRLMPRGAMMLRRRISDAAMGAASTTHMKPPRPSRNHNG